MRRGAPSTIVGEEIGELLAGGTSPETKHPVRTRAGSACATSCSKGSSGSRPITWAAAATTAAPGEQAQQLRGCHPSGCPHYRSNAIERAWWSERPLRCRFVTEPTTQGRERSPQDRTFAELPIGREEDRTLRAVLVGMLRETGR